ncbi:hypothetical protein HK104_010971 [Borealophlyctis nickersoniae]|nr:hypothetical protein HK104_010971 [Borealophlyctis nickersoniae]
MAEVAPSPQQTTQQSAPQTTLPQGLPFPYPLAFLRKHTLGDVVEKRDQAAGEKQELIDMWENESVEKALEKMNRHNITAIPVYHVLDDGRRKHYAMVTVRDIIGFAIFKPLFDHPVEENLSPEEKQKKEEKLMVDQAIFFQHTLADLIGITKESFEIHTFRRSDHLTKLINVFENGIHYAFIESSDGDYSTVISQSDVIRFLEPERDGELKDMCRLHVQSAMRHAIELRMFDDPNQCYRPTAGRKLKYAIRVDRDVDALQAYKTMHLQRLTSAAIVDTPENNHKLLASISKTDFKYVTRDTVSDLFQPVMDYLTKAQGGVVRSPLTVGKDATMGDVLAKCLEENVHGVWVVDPETGAPLGRVSLTDAMSCLVPSEGAREGQVHKLQEARGETVAREE